MSNAASAINHHHEIAETNVLLRNLEALRERLSKLPPTRERASAATNLQLGGMWLKEDLERINAARVMAAATNAA